MRAAIRVLSIVLLLAACGGPQPIERHITAFRSEHEPLFENGLDMVQDPDALEGSWLHTWEDELDRRITEADVVALVSVQTVRTDTDLERRDTFRLIGRVEREYLGELEDEISLNVAEGEAGYGTVENNERRLLDAQFIAFIKWQRTDAGQIRARWHLSPATDAVATRVRDRLRERRDYVEESDGTRRRVIIHRN